MKQVDVIPLGPRDRVEVVLWPQHAVRITRGKVVLLKSENPGGYIGEAWSHHEIDDTKPAKPSNVRSEPPNWRRELVTETRPAKKKGAKKRAD